MDIHMQVERSGGGTCWACVAVAEGVAGQSFAGDACDVTVTGMGATPGAAILDAAQRLRPYLGTGYVPRVLDPRPLLSW